MTRQSVSGHRGLYDSWSQAQTLLVHSTGVAHYRQTQAPSAAFYRSSRLITLSGAM